MVKSKRKQLAQGTFIKLCQTFGLPTPTPEFMFAKSIGRKWRIDYYFTNGDIKVALEVEGGVWTGGRHTRPQGFLNDVAKYNALSKMGIYLIRVQPSTLSTMHTI